MLGRLVHKADFERLLAKRWRLRSAHFAIHHVGQRPFVPAKCPVVAVEAELSTAAASPAAAVVDKVGDQVWVGCVVPKRHAKRAVTRNLLKRQIRAAFARHAGLLPGGLWLVRLREGFAPAQFISARSGALAVAAREELDGLLGRAAS
ncbi:MAG: ribonuclease P protein component [Rubrivivax sp.]|nr:ribonuclease P protein component [Rubrivivax sp.]